MKTPDVGGRTSEKEKKTIVSDYLRTEEDRIIFKATLNQDGVVIVPDTLIDLIEKIEQKIGLKIKYSEGNFKETSFIFNRTITEQEAEQIESILSGQEISGL